MKPACFAAVAKAIGRALTASESKDLENRVNRSMRELARKDSKGWQAKSVAEQLQEGAAAAAQQLVQEAHLARTRESLAVLASARIAQHIKDSAARGIDGMDALERVLAFSADGKSNFQSVEYQTHAIEHDALRRMIGTLEASHPRFFGLFENQEGVAKLVRELFGEDTGDADAKAGAKQFHEVAESLRQRFNRAGGDVGKLDQYDIPHHHSQLRVAKAGRDAWVNDVLPRLDRDSYFNEDGTRMNDGQLRDFLGEAWTTIATGGANKLEPGTFRASGSRANRGNASRQIHFKNADAYMQYQAQFGERTPYEVIASHISGLAKDVALVETMGPNPDNAFRFFRDSIAQKAKLADPTKVGKIDEQAIHAESLYNVVSGKTQPVASELLARSFDTLRNWLMASRLGSAIITSFSDDATLHLTGRMNNLPEMRLLANELAAFNPANREEERLAQTAGLAWQTHTAVLNRFGTDGLGSSFSKKLSNTVLRASGLNAATDARRRAFGVTFMGSLGAISKRYAALKDLSATDHRILLSKGITDSDFAVWKAAKLENWGGGNDTMLTPESIYRISDAALHKIDPNVLPQQLREQAATKLLGTVLEETDVAVIEPGARDRLVTGGQLQRGTWKGELTKSFFLFKSFPLAMINKHWQRGMSLPNTGGRAAYLATLLAATTAAGLASLQVDQVLQGKDPRNLNVFEKGGVRNWIAAMLKGGSLGIYGDFLFSDSTQYGNSPLGTLTGPVLGAAEDFINLTQGNVVQYLNGKPTHAGAELVRFVKGNTPGASLWYAKAALDHLIFHQLQEYFSPGYLNNLRAKAEQQYGQQYWWQPGKAVPDRAPDPTAMAGK